MRIASRIFAVAAVVGATTSCGSVVRSSRAPVILVIDSLAAIRGAATPGQPVSNLVSDVYTIVTTGGTCTTSAPCPTIFGDSGQAVVHIVLKDIGLPGTTPAASTNNQVTITRVHVSYRRTDGRNQEGVDVPYGFDSASTATVTGSTTVTMGFPLVRSQAKEEAPLIELRDNGLEISAIADVTFYGQDVVGNAISVTGSISVDFANFGDF
ncbi:MAG TPA: hypothetical protein VG871_01135 [Vicinamibacterales bacterium]|nr:hypothetical protein [Vicinamibacterales bacterium]